MGRTVRPATVDDVQAIVGLGASLMAESPRFSRLTFNADRLADFVAELLELDLGFVLVAEVDGVVVGALLAMADQHYAADDLIAYELALFVSPSHRGAALASILVGELRDWAMDIGATWVQAGTATGVEVDRTVRLYESQGFDRCGVILEASNVHRA